MATLDLDLPNSAVLSASGHGCETMSLWLCTASGTPKVARAMGADLAGRH
jgi:hypothetical protein